MQWVFRDIKLEIVFTDIGHQMNEVINPHVTPCLSQKDFGFGYLQLCKNGESNLQLRKWMYLHDKAASGCDDTLGHFPRSHMQLVSYLRYWLVETGDEPPTL